MDVEMGVSREQNPLIAAAPLFTVTGTVSGSVAGRVTFAISDASWSLIVDGNFDANGRYLIFYDVQQKDPGGSTNKGKVGGGGGGWGGGKGALGGGGGGGRET